MIVMYNCYDQKDKMFKTLLNEHTLNSRINASEIDLRNPSIIIKSDDLTGNYIYISELRRYYFIESKQMIDNVHVNLNLKCDVLFTFRNEINESQGLLSKGGNINPYFANYNSECRNHRIDLNFNSPFKKDGEFVLVTIANGV